MSDAAAPTANAESVLESCHHAWFYESQDGDSDEDSLPPLEEDAESDDEPPALSPLIHSSKSNAVAGARVYPEREMAMLAMSEVAQLIVSYDVLCQYDLNFRQNNCRVEEERHQAHEAKQEARMAEFRHRQREVREDRYMPANWHLCAHSVACPACPDRFCVGHSDGEGVERAWAVLKPAPIEWCFTPATMRSKFPSQGRNLLPSLMDNTPDPPPGSAGNLFALADTPPKVSTRKKKKRRRPPDDPTDFTPGSMANLFLFALLPVLKRLADANHKEAHAGMVRNHQQQLADVAQEHRLNRRALETSVSARERATDVLVAASGRIRALEATVLSVVPTNFGGPAAGPSQRRGRVAAPSLRRQEREVRENTHLRHVSMVAALEAPAAPSLPSGPIVNVFGGWRRPRTHPLTEEALWKYREGPPDQLATYEHHMCTVCHFVKSHPVSYTCGHSHCYVCVRLWLERKWTCPECRKPMDRAPFRHYPEEQGIESEYPGWGDNSVVDYSFEGLTFPTVETVLAADTP
ncbi:hypothetical protein B0H17DRAFT_1214976 [Mycena rosella]|uniref:RING-type domain-containing protein n=1 Tax=Mycena rosella TaxID=1033263 RepID=A0AAD7CMF7_MYCRO|nr:hypothetical protein B0H17DRAFT_1214976 [Mycena rosella]